MIAQIGNILGHAGILVGGGYACVRGTLELSEHIYPQTEWRKTSKVALYTFLMVLGSSVWHTVSLSQ